jgi:cysteinyl-tRNA synthetase
MDSLNVEYPDAITRVSDYVLEIIQFIEKIISNGFAYESNSSVYFDVPKYIEAGVTSYNIIIVHLLQAQLNYRFRKVERRRRRHLR